MGERIEKIGEYTVRFKEDGRKVITGPGLRRAAYLPSDKDLLKRYQEEKSKGPLSMSLIEMFCRRGILVSGRKSSIDAMVDLNIQPRTILFEEIEDKIRSFWTKEYYNHVMAGGELKEGKGLKDFSKMYRRQWMVCGKKRFGGFRKVLDKIYPGFYSRIHRANCLFEDIDVCDLRNRLLGRVYSGLPINKSYLESSNDSDAKQILAEVRILMSRDNLGITSLNYTEKVAEITGLSVNDICISMGGRKKVAILSEALTAFALSWAQLFGNDFGGVVGCSDEIRFSGKDTLSFEYGAGRTGLADLRIGNVAVEVKGRTDHLLSREDYFLGRYSPELNSWKSGELMENSMVVFHQPTPTNNLVPTLENAGIYVISSRDFHLLLKDVVKGIRKNFKSVVADVRPRIHNLEELVRLHREISLNPTLLAKESNAMRRNYFTCLFKSLFLEAERLKEENR